VNQSGPELFMPWVTKCLLYATAAAPALVEVAGATMTSPQQSGRDIMDQLKQLGELHKAGILTDDKFAAKKAEMLNRL
jgi:hypothetical protein